MTLTTTTPDPVPVVLTSQRNPVPVHNKRPRVAIYDGSTIHSKPTRKHRCIAQALSRVSPSVETLLIHESRQAMSIGFPSRTDTLTLPVIAPDLNEQAPSRGLPITQPQLIRLRSRTIQAALSAFDPDVLIVEGTPRGRFGELDAALKAIRAQPATRCVLALHDPGDLRTLMNSQWDRRDHEQALADDYDAVWVFADPTPQPCFDPFQWKVYALPQVRYVGDPAGHDASIRLSRSMEQLLTPSTIPLRHPLTWSIQHPRQVENA